MLTPAEWHYRFKLQARWTQQLRNYLLKEVIVTKPQRILEVGCGSGVILEELHQSELLAAHSHVLGLDIRLDFLRLTRAQGVEVVSASADALPFPQKTFDLVYCHFLLLWLKRPLHALMEMKRITQPGGWVIAMAEPDYAHRIDYPPLLAKLGKLQRQALIQQGANPDIGCMLGGLFQQAGYQNVKTGLLGGEWNVPQTKEMQEGEWHILETDLEKWISPRRLLKYRQQDAIAWQKGERVLFIPTFYALGQVINSS